MSPRILIVDDQAVVRSGFRVLLEDEPGFEIVGEAQDGREAIALVARRRPDVVLMDIRMPGMDGLEATRRLTRPDAEHPVKVIVITTFDLDEYVFAALRAGAAGFLLKDAQPEVLIDAIHAVASGYGLIAPEVTGRLIREFAAVSPNPDTAKALDALSARERDVLLLIAQGNSNAQIASQLFLEESTVKTHVSSILAKLNLNSRVQAVILAYESRARKPRNAARGHVRLTGSRVNDRTHNRASRPAQRSCWQCPDSERPGFVTGEIATAELETHLPCAEHGGAPSSPTGFSAYRCGCPAESPEATLTPKVGQQPGESSASVRSCCLQHLPRFAAHNLPGGNTWQLEP